MDGQYACAFSLVRLAGAVLTRSDYAHAMSVKHGFQSELPAYRQTGSGRWC